jgi:BASS family bile acid:Na+ symporter
MGQKNTVFAIWLGYTFMTPETAIVGGLYSIWHNIYNSWQLRSAAAKD